MTELYASAMMIGGTTGMAIIAIWVGRPISDGARTRLDAAGRE